MKTVILIIVKLTFLTFSHGQKPIIWNTKKDTTITLLNKEEIVELFNHKIGDTLYYNANNLIVLNNDTLRFINNDSQWQIKNGKATLDFKFENNLTKFTYLKDANRKSDLNLNLETKEMTSPSNQDVKKITQLTKLFPNVDCRYGEIKNLKVDFCKYLDSFSCDQLIVIDVAPYISGLSGIYSSDSKGKCKRKCCGVDICKNTKLLITNINPYLYTVSITQAQTNIGPDMQSTDLSQPNQDGDLHSLEYTNDKYNKILLYAQAVIELKTFIECVKANTNPIEEILENNKRIINDILYEKKLLSTENIDSLYRILTDTIKIELKKYYQTAKLFPSVYNEFKNLSYSLSSTILPIQTKSFDKFVLTVTLYDKNNKKVDVQEYEYLIKGGWKVDQSFGLIGHGLTDRRYFLKEEMGFDTTYALRPNGVPIKDSILSLAPTVYKTILGGNRTFPALGISTLTNIYYRVSHNFNFGAGLGISADFYPDTNVRYLTGLSCIFKDTRNRVGLNFGWAWGRYRALSSEQIVGDKIKGVNSTPNIIEHFGGSFYLGVSYQSQIFSFDNTQKETKEVGK